MSSLDRIKKKREQLLVENNKSYSSTDKSMERISSLRNELSTTGKIDYGDIAPIKFDNTSTKEEDKKRSWFSAGAFDDGYDFGDITKTILGTAADVGTNVVKGLTSMGEGIGKLGAGGVAQIADWIGQDEYADKVRNRLAGKDEEYNEFWNKISPTANVNRVSDKLDTSSFIGEKSDDLVSSAGNLLGSAAGQMVGIPWWVTMGTSSAGQELENAYKSGATDGEAWTSAAISGASEILFEKLSGGIKFGGRTLDEGLKRTLSNAITNKTAQTLTKLGFDMVGEGAEEVLTEITSNIGKKLTYEDEKTWGEALASEEAMDNYLEAFIGGAVMGGVFNSGKVVSSLKTGRDYDTGLTANEQKVVDSEVAKRTEGKNLTKKQIAEIETEVKNELEKGYISTDTIESVLGGDTYNNLKSTKDNKTKIENEIKKLEGKKNAEITVKEMEHLKDLREQLKGIDTNTLETDLQGKMGQIIKSDGYLQRSYQEKAKRGQKFTYDASKVTNEFEKAALESASKVMNDTNRSHEFVEPVVKLAKDKGTYYEFTNNAELEKSNYDVKGKQVNGLVTVEKDGKKKILINVDSAKALNTIVGHETTHLLEGTQEYQELQDAIFNYAKTKGDFDSRQASLYSLYKGIKGADVNSELTADLVGDYLFTDNNFISELSTQKPTVFQKIKELIDDLVVRFKGTKEEKALREVQKKFKEAYRQQTGQQTGTQYSLSEVDLKQKQLDIVLENNPANDDYHTWIRSIDDIKTYQEALQEDLDGETQDLTPDFKKADLEKALETGKMTVYSSYPIEQGIFVTPSKMEAQSYAGSNKVYSKEVNLKDVAWIDTLQGQYAKAEDIGYSLSNQNEIAPRNPNLTYGEDVKLQVEETIAPLQEEIQTLTETVNELKEQIAPVRDEYAPLTEEDLPYLEQQYNEAPKEDIAPPEIEENIPVAEDEITPTKSLFETRNYEEVGNRKVNAYQYDNPEVKPYFQEAARSMIDDLANSLKGQRIYNDQLYYDTAGEQGYFGINRFTSNDIAELLDGVDGKYKLSYKDLEKGLKAIIEDKGAENNAASKRIEFYLDKRLREGFKTLDGVEIPANQEYLKLLEAIETTDYHNSIPIGEAPVENVGNPVGNVSNTKVSEEIAPIKEQEVQQPVEEKQNLSIKESNALKLKNYEKALDKYNSDAEESLKAFNELILEKKKQYSGLSNRNTQKANNLLQQITRIETQRDNAQVEYERKMNNVQKRIDKMNSKDFKTAEQRISKQDEYRQQARELIGDTSTWKDKKMGIQYQIHTFKRNLRDIVRGVDGKADLLKADAIYEEYEGKYDKNEAKLKVEYNRIMNPYAELDLTEQEHIYTQMLGEFKYNPDTTLTKDVVDSYYNKNKSKIDTNKVNNAIESARKTYDELFNRINERLKEQGMKELEYRRGYFPHFIEEKQGLLAKIFDWKIHKDDIPTDIAGLTELNNPERSWQTFNKHRESDITDYNFGKGLETYVRGALDWIYHIEDIQKRRALENEIRYQHSEKGIQEQIEAIYTDTELDTDQIQERIDSIYKNAQNPLNNFVTDFRNATNRLANKKSTMDRSLEYATNRRIYSTMTNLSNRVSGNMIGGSISSALTNFIPITQSWGEVSPLSSLQAARETIKNATIDDGTIAKSTFLTNRLVKNENLYKTGWDKVQDKIAIMTDVIDSFTSQTVWRSKYNENIANGMSETEAIANADNFAKNVIAGRSRGNEPTIFHSKNPITKMFTAFQIEVANQYDYMFKDMPKDVENQSKAKLIKGYATMFVGAYLYNALYSSLVGRDAAFDPIGIVEDILKELGFGDDEEEEEKTASEKFTAITEDLVQQLPFVGGLFGGGRVPISAAIPYDNPIEMVKGTATDLLDALDEEKREKAIKDLTSEWLKPVTYLALPVGGGQINKTIQGLSMYDDDLPVAGSYTNSGDLRFTADKSMGGIVKSALFGRWASDSAQEYVDSGFKTIKKSNIDEMVDLDMSSTEYRKYKANLTKAGKTTDKNGYAKYLDDDGNTYWYDKNSKTLYDSDYEESNLSVVDLEKASKNEQIYEYITGLDVSDEQKEIMFNNAINPTTTDKYGYTKYVDDSNKTYWYDEETDTLYNSGYKKVDNDLLFELTEYSGKDLSNYDNFGNYEEFDYATKNPDKYRVIEQIDTFDNYNSYKTEIENIKERYSTDEELTSKQKTALSKQRKAAVQQYINSLSLDIPQKIMLEKMAGGYSIKDYENYMFSYIQSLPMTAEEKQAIHKQLFD